MGEGGAGHKRERYIKIFRISWGRGELDHKRERYIKIFRISLHIHEKDLSPCLLFSFIGLFNLNSVFYNGHQSNSSHKLLKLVAAARPEINLFSIWDGYKLMATNSWLQTHGSFQCKSSCIWLHCIS